MSTHVFAAVGKKPAWALFGVLFAFTTGAMAETRLGYEGNIYLLNPYADPAGSYYGFGIATGDFDGDGIDDLVVSELGSSERFRVMRGIAYPIGGPYPLSRFTAKTVATPFYGSVLATGDFNGDGLDEVAIGDRNSNSNPGAAAASISSADRLRRLVAAGNDPQGTEATPESTKPVTSSVPRWPVGTSTAMVTRTWPSACRAGYRRQSEHCLGRPVQVSRSASV